MPPLTEEEQRRLVLCAHLGRKEEAKRAIEEVIAQRFADDRYAALGLHKALESVRAGEED
jgi:hypothetical protein